MGDNGRTIIVRQLLGLLGQSGGSDFESILPALATRVVASGIQISAAGVLTGFDADKLDGQDGSYYLNASNLNAGTLPDARFPATLPAASGVNLTALNGTNVASGTVADARLSSNVPKKDAANVFSVAGNSFSEVVGAAKGVQFPATQVASADANCLDDYEEGAWTPVIGGSGGTSGQTYGTTSGRYTKVGRMVFVEFTITLTVKGTITGAVQIQGLPFTPSGVTAGLVIPQFANMGTNWITLGGIPGGGTAITLYGMQAAAASSLSLTTTDIANNTTMVGSMTFTV